MNGIFTEKRALYPFNIQYARYYGSVYKKNKRMPQYPLINKLCVYKMTTILLDSNIYDELSNDEAVRNSISNLIQTKTITVVAPQIVLDEMKNSPFKGIPNFFPVEAISDGVAVAGLAKAGAAIVSEGKTYTKHKGNSKQSKDAIIAETALNFSDVFVSQDNHCRERLKSISNKTQCFDYQEFKKWIENT